MRRVLLVLGLAIALLFSATTTAAADWSMAGGDAARTGSTSAEPSAYPAILWATPVTGPVLGSPVVSRNPGAGWGATVYAVSGGTLGAMNAADGILRWSAPLSSYSSAPWVVRAQGGLASDADHVYALVTEQNGVQPDWRETLFVRNRPDGSAAWNYSGSMYSSLGPPAIASSPLRVRDLVVFGSGDGHVRALQASTGALVWDASGGNRIPFPVTFLGTGNALVGDFILAPNDAGSLLGLDVNGTANGDQGIVDPPGSTGDLVWTASLGANADGAALATPVAAYIAAGSRLLALHPAFGSTIWSQTLPSSIVAPLALAGNSLITGADDDRVRSLNATTGAIEWVRALGGLEPWLVATPTRILTGAGASMVALSPATGEIAWTGAFGSPIPFASVSENATGRGTIYAAMTSPDRIVAFGGSYDLRARDITVSPLASPDVFQASIDASILNAGDENVSRSFHVWLNDTVTGQTTVLANVTVPYLRPGDGFPIRIVAWNFSTGTHKLNLSVEVLPGERDRTNNALVVSFFTSAGPPKVLTVWSSGFWIGLVVVGVAGLGAGWMIAVANRRRETEAAETARARQEPHP